MPDILIIDTSEPFVTTLRGEINQMGHRSEVATTLPEELTLADREPFDVVFMSADMPGGRGVDVLPRLVSLATAPILGCLRPIGILSTIARASEPLPDRRPAQTARLCIHR